MSGFRLIHTGDLHLGRRFGALPEAARDRLAEARHAVIPRLAQAARDHGAAHILVAGDMFDTGAPAPRVWRQALTAMGASGCRWWILPGNHDSLAAEPLWDGIRAHAPDTVTILDRPEPVEIAPGIQLLPAPLTHAHAGRDATAWMAAADTPPGHRRIGLAHGPIAAFGEAARDAEVIPPDRATTAGLDYLALGDWHGTQAIGPRTWYAGTPERDSFRHQGRGACLAVTLADGAAPEVTPVTTGAFDWAARELTLTPGMDPGAALDHAMADPAEARRDMVVSLRLSGRVTLADRARLADRLAAIAPDYWHLHSDLTGLASDVAVTDLDAIAETGVLRQAADVLALEAQRAATEDDRRIAAGALDLLYTLARGGAA